MCERASILLQVTKPQNNYIVDSTQVLQLGLIYEKKSLPQLFLLLLLVVYIYHAYAASEPFSLNP